MCLWEPGARAVSIAIGRRQRMMAVSAVAGFLLSRSERRVKEVIHSTFNTSFFLLLLINKYISPKTNA